MGQYTLQKQPIRCLANLVPAPGETIPIKLGLKLIADVGLIGFPNAGKSTLLSRLSAATPKIGAYPFTTLDPQLGVIDTYDRQLVVADIPGLMRGPLRGLALGTSSFATSSAVDCCCIWSTVLMAM